MKKNIFLRVMSLFLCIVSVAAAALFVTGCNDGKEQVTENISEKVPSNLQKIGEGKHVFMFTVKDADGNTNEFEVRTDCDTVGEALLGLELIAGDEGPYGLYIKTAAGITYDYDKDGKYWAFYVNGEYASAGVDTTKIEDGTKYMLKAE